MKNEAGLSVAQYEIEMFQDPVKLQPFCFFCASTVVEQRVDELRIVQFGVNSANDTGKMLRLEDASERVSGGCNRIRYDHAAHWQPIENELFVLLQQALPL